MNIIILAPVVAGLLILIFRKIPAAFGIAGSLVSLMGSVILLYKEITGKYLTLQMPGFPGMPFILKATPSTAVFSLIVAVVALLIFVYGKGYMTDKNGKNWFWCGMSLFIASMQLLILAADWILFLIAWELMGLASYLLIATWHWEAKARKGATKAFLLTRVADMGLYVGIFIIILQTGSDIIQVHPAHPISLFGALALLFAVMGKSAQVPFQSWLSSAMAGPTPVSALLHSATMVAAGVVLLVRIFPMLPHESLFYIGIVGSVTIVLTGLTALFNNDIKQLLAASTSSQLGFMLLAIAAGYPAAAIAHLFAHAFMKSSLFLSGGIFQHQNKGTSFTTISGSGRKAGWAFAGWIIAGLALAGIPPFIGYRSKDAILSAGFLSTYSGLYFSIAIVGALLTALYIGRSIRLLWFGEEKLKAGFHGVMFMRSGVVVLLLFVAAGGFYLDRVLSFIGFNVPEPETAKISGLIAAIAGLVIGAFIRSPDFKWKPLKFVQANYPIAGGYQQWVTLPVLRLAFLCSRFDLYLHEMILSAGKGFLLLSKTVFTIEKWIFRLAVGIGKGGLVLSALSVKADGAGIETAINSLTESVRRSGQMSRKIQSGLVHKELLWSLMGVLTLGIILLILFI